MRLRAPARTPLALEGRRWMPAIATAAPPRSEQAAASALSEALYVRLGIVLPAGLWAAR